MVLGLQKTPPYKVKGVNFFLSIKIAHKIKNTKLIAEEFCSKTI